MTKFILLIVILFSSCSEKKDDGREKPVQRERTDWVVMGSTDSIPDLMILTLKKIAGDEFRIAGPDESFESTDVLLYDSLPRRQMRFLARKNNMWRLTYIQGGFGKHYVFAESEIIGDTFKSFRFSQTTAKLENNDSIKKYLTAGELKPQNIQILVK